MDWTVTDSTQILRDRWISLRADNCSTADGAPVAPYWVLDHVLQSLDEFTNSVMEGSRWQALHVSSAFFALSRLGKLQVVPR